jgi:hypothetical protein
MFAFDQERPLERERGVDRHHQVLRGDVGIGAFKTHRGGLSSGIDDIKNKIIEQPLRKRTAVNLEINAQRASQAQPGNSTQRETLSSTTLMNDSDVVNRSGPVA